MIKHLIFFCWTSSQWICCISRRWSYQLRSLQRCGWLPWFARHHIRNQIGRWCTSCHRSSTRPEQSHREVWSFGVFLLRWKGFPELKIFYQSVGEFLDEALKVKRSSSSWVIDVHDQFENNFILLIKSESLSSLEELSAVSSSLSGVGVKWEESVEFGDVFWWEDGVFGGDVFWEDSFELFGLDFFLAHFRYIKCNKLKLKWIF